MRRASLKNCPGLQLAAVSLYIRVIRSLRNSVSAYREFARTSCHRSLGRDRQAQDVVSYYVGDSFSWLFGPYCPTGVAAGLLPPIGVGGPITAMRIMEQTLKMSPSPRCSPSPAWRLLACTCKSLGGVFYFCCCKAVCDDCLCLWCSHGPSHYESCNVVLCMQVPYCLVLYMQSVLII